jgi:hypothetical protein
MDDPHLGYITKLRREKRKEKTEILKFSKRKKKKDFFFKEKYFVEENRESLKFSKLIN